jgi:ubiquinone/menaquinone biosynthesis C-methylase UbiE
VSVKPGQVQIAMTNKAEGLVSQFYNTVGWETAEGITEDARRWEDLRSHAREYVSKCRLRVLRHIPESGLNILDMASGPIQYKEYLEYSKNFSKRYCVDLSEKALEGAKEKIGAHGVFLHGSFLDIPFENDLFLIAQSACIRSTTSIKTSRRRRYASC